MSGITAQAVKSLRDRTSAGMMDCKRALQEAGGDEERAIDLLRQWGAAKAAKRAERMMREGIVWIETTDAGVAMVEVTSETDFVARNDEFREFARRLAEAVAESELESGSDVGGDQLLAEGGFAALSAELEDLRAKIGENLEVRRVVRYGRRSGAIGAYLHFGNRIGALVELEGSGAEEAQDLARELAMHVAAANPAGVSPEDIPAEERERERTVLAEQTRQEGKPEHIIDRIVDGRMRKFFEQNALLMQDFVKDHDTKVGALLEARDPGLRVRRFARFEIGG